MKTLNDAALALCERINKRSDCFKTIYLVFPNLKLQQWFKAFWLNTQGDRVLMNVSFETLDSILPLITERTGQEKYRLIKVNNLRQIIINILSNDLVQVDEEYKKYYEINGVKTPIKLYDFADSLAKLYLDYYLDNFEDIDKWGDPNSFERVLYDKVVELCKATKLGTIEKPAAKASPVDELIYLFGFGKYEKVYRKLLDEVIAKNPNNIVDFSIAIDRSIATSSRTYEICTAPSRVREVEYLHSTICELLNDKNNINRAIDFLVVAPNLDEYVTAIERVFKQDDKTFPSIPYVINYQQKKDTDVISALKILYQYCKDDFYTRLDFFELINNPVVRTVRKISDDDIDNWMKAVVDLKIHRQHGDNYKVDDWDYLKKRLVLSKVSSVNFTEDNLVALSEGNYLPYSNIGFDDNSIIKLVDIINDIDDFYSYFKSKTTININDAFIQEFKTKLDKWFKVTNIKDKAFAEYRKITSSLECLKTISAQNIDKDVLFSVLFNDGAISSTQLGTSFFEGVTFLNYDINSVVSAKYVFLLGASSNHLPKAIIKSELDFRLGPKTSDDEDIFYYLMQNATERFYMSFVNKDLKTDENFFLSPIVEDFNKLKGQEIKEISLDETRPYSDLYTRKEFNDREYYKNLFNNPANQWQPQAKAKPSRNVLPPSAAPRDIVTVSQMKAFLCEPLSYRAGRLFNKEDELQDEIIDEYEPLTLNKLETYGLSTDIVLRKLGDRYDFAETLSLFRLSHLLPTINSSYERNIYQSLEKRADSIIDIINVITDNGKGEIIPPREIIIDGWTLKASQTYYRYIAKNGDRFYIEFKKNTEKQATSKFLNLYLLSLMDLAINEGKDSCTYKIILALGPKDEDLIEQFKPRFQYEFKITKKKAIETLKTIHDLMDDYTNNVAVPIDLAEKDIDQYFELTDGIFDKHGAWDYFDHASVFDKDNIGYDSDNFVDDDFIDELNKQIELIKFLNKKKKAVNNNGQP